MKRNLSLGQAEGGSNIKIQFVSEQAKKLGCDVVRLRSYFDFTDKKSYLNSGLIPEVTCILVNDHPLAKSFSDAQFSSEILPGISQYKSDYLKKMNTSSVCELAVYGDMTSFINLIVEQQSKETEAFNKCREYSSYLHCYKAISNQELTWSGEIKIKNRRTQKIEAMTVNSIRIHAEDLGRKDIDFLGTGIVAHIDNKDIGSYYRQNVYFDVPGCGRSLK
jgi:hypothetical protein